MNSPGIQQIRDVSRFITGAAAVLVILAAVTPYLNSLTNDFTWDDDPLIVRNYRIKNIQYLPQVFSADFFGHVDEKLKYGYYRPVVTLSYMMNDAVAGDRPAVFRGVNILLHAWITLGVFFLARRLYPSRTALAAAIAILFGVHPIHTESVTWISGRTDLLATAMMMGSLLTLIKYWLDDASHWWVALSSLLFALALLSKESALIFPGLAAGFLWLFPSSRSKRAAWWITGGYSGLLAGYLVIRFLVLNIDSATGLPMTLPVRIQSTFSTVFLYIRKLVFPLDLTAYITNPPALSPLDLRFIAGMVLTCLAAGVCIRYRTDRRIMFLFGFTLLSFLPSLHAAGISTPPDMGFPAADRFVYMPSVGVIALSAVLLDRWLPSRRILAALFLLAGTGYSIVTLHRNHAWRNNETLYYDCLARSPEAPLLWNNLGSCFLRQERYEESARCLKKALEYGGRTPELLTNYAVTQRYLGAVETSEELLLEALRIAERAATYQNLGLVYLKRKQPAKAEEMLLRALELDPENLDSRIELAELYRGSGRYADAVSRYRESIDLHPGSAPLWSNLGVVFKQWGRMDDAEHAFKRSIELDSSISAAHTGLGVVYAQKEHWLPAEDSLITAILLDTANTDALNALGILYTRTNRLHEAERLFSRIVETFPADPEAYINMFILKYMTKDMDTSISWLQLARKMAPNDPRVNRYVQLIDHQSGVRE